MSSRGLEGGGGDAHMGKLSRVQGIRRETGRDKMLFSFVQGRTANAGSPALFAPGRQISG